MGASRQGRGRPSGGRMSRGRRHVGTGSDESLRGIVRALDRQERVARRRAARQAAEPRERPAPRPPPLPPPRPAGRPPGPTRAEIDGYVARMISDPVAGPAAVGAELWERYAADKPTAKARDRAHAVVVALVADVWAERRAGS